MKRIVVIGSGNLAEALAQALARAEVGLVQIWARNAERAAHLGALCGVPYASRAEALAEADLYLVAVSDRAVGEVTASLPIPAEALVAHTAGSVPIEVLPTPRRGAFYPFQSFTAGRQVDFRPIPIFIEASEPQDLALLRKVAERLSDRVEEADGEQRRRIHLSGVFACNLVNALYGVGEEVVRQAGFSFEILKPLILETAQKAIASHHPSEVQTGPAVRGDQAVQEQHLRMIQSDTIRQIYALLSHRIWETSKKM